MTALLLAALLLVLACATYYDATGFPREGTGPSSAPSTASSTRCKPSLSAVTYS